jgi:two-component system, NtrC family, response regulator PilR
MAVAKLLIVDDELSMREILAILFENDGYEVQIAPNIAAAQQQIGDWTPDVILSDLNLPGGSGIDLLRWVKKCHSDIVFVMLTAFGSNQSAVEALKLGAANYVLKPFNNDELRLVVSRALGVRNLEQENAMLKGKSTQNLNFGLFVGDSPAMLEVYEMIRRISRSKINCMILGASGTGKEMVARAIHNTGDRFEYPFVTINCGAIPENLVESELFGHVKGAFTNAYRDKMGLLEVANHGTIFLDEVDALPLATQVKILRVIQDKRIQPVGGVESTLVDVRFICASNADMEQRVKDGLFREDLYYRLNVVEVYLPLLRERTKDIEPLVHHFIERFSREYGKQIMGISPEFIQSLRGWTYPGNVRELQNAMERAVALSVGNVLQREDLPDVIWETGLRIAPSGDELPQEGLDLDALLTQIERKWLLSALDAMGGKKKQAAEKLHMTFRSFRYRLLKHNLE